MRRPLWRRALTAGILALAAMRCGGSEQPARTPNAVDTLGVATESTLVRTAEPEPSVVVPATPLPTASPTRRPVPSTFESTPCSGMRERPGGFEVTFQPFCVWWDDSSSDEIGFRIEVIYNGNPSAIERFEHNVVSNDVSYAFPPAEWPRLDEPGYFLRRHSASIRIFALRPGTDDLIGGTDFTAR